MFEDFLKEVKVTHSENTYKTYKANLSYFKGITPDDILEFIENSQDKVSTVTIKKRLVILGTYLKWLGGDHSKALKIIAKYKDVKVKKDCPPDKAIEFILDYAKSFRDKVIILLITQGGLRVSEVSNLNMSDVKPQSITLRDTKNHTTVEQIVPKGLVKEIYKYINEERLQTDKDALFTTKNGRISVRTIQQTIAALFDYVGYKGFTVHSLRRYYCNTLLSHNVNLAIVQEAMRHKSITSTQTYCNITEEQIKSAIKEIW